MTPKEDPPESSLVKRSVRDHDMKVFEMYFQRANKEYDLIWTRFKIYFSISVGGVVAVGFVIKPYLDKDIARLHGIF